MSLYTKRISIDVEHFLKKYFKYALELWKHLLVCAVLEKVFGFCFQLLGRESLVGK